MVGTTVSHYKIIDHLGAGGMSVVYKAQDLKLERTVALKFLPTDLTRDPRAKQRLLQEARIASAMQHKNICIIFDVDETEDGRMFISMEYLHGLTLLDRIANGVISIAESVRIASQAAAGLAHAHAAGIVHRDIKPANIMLASDGTTKVLDFGLARTQTSQSISSAGALVGTVSYMSPEQVGCGAVDQRTDVWSLGVVLYELIAGVRPFQNDYTEAVLYAILHEEPLPLRSKRPEIPATLEAIVARCLDKRPEQRFQDGGALLEALQHLGDEPAQRDPNALRSVAILPFVDISPEKDNRYFSDGLTEEIISRLARLQHLRIVSRNSVMAYDRTGKTSREIARDLRVEYLLEGSVRKYGTGLRIAAQLVDAAEDSYLWAETYTGTMEDIFDIQEDVAGRVVRALKLHLSPDDRRSLARRSTDDTAAYQAYLKGQFFLSKRSKEALQTAIHCFEEALALDPRHAPSWAGIADGYLLLNEFVGTPGMETYPQAKAAVRKALEIDDELAEAHTACGLLLWVSEWDWGKAEQEFRRAIAASPSYATAYHWYAELLGALGRTEEAFEMIGRAIELDPVSPAAIRDSGLIRYYARQYDAAIAEADRALELDPNFASAHRVRSLAYQAQGEFAKSLAEHALWSRGKDLGDEPDAAYAQCLAAAGRREEARDILKRMPRRDEAGGNLARAIALVHAALGDKDEAFAWLERGCEVRAEAMGTLRVDPKADPLRSDPRFITLLRRVGLER